MQTHLEDIFYDPFINNLLSPSHSDLLELFEEYGAVKHIFLLTNWKTKPLAFVEMSVKARRQLSLS